MIAIKNVLVATDFSECSDAALRYARALSGQFGARLHVLHAIELVGAVDVAGIGVFSPATPEFIDELESDARGRLNRLLEPTDKDALKAQTVVTTGGTPPQAIVDYAKEEDIDLIVVGTHGRRGLSHFLLGSVAERVLRQAPCPVLTVRHPQHEFVIGDTRVGESAVRM